MSTTTLSIDRFRRTKRNTVSVADAVTASPAHPLTGTALGTLERRYGLMCSEETIVVDEVISTSGDLAVADRLAFVAATQRHIPVAVIEVDGWFIACTTERVISPSEVSHLRTTEDNPRMMSLVTEKGITPALGPFNS